jgi:hypothetical protein
MTASPAEPSGRIHSVPSRHAGRVLARMLITVAVLTAAGVAVVGGLRSFEAVSARFDSVLVPLTADGMIVACTALRLAALSRRWRLPGSLLVTYGFIVGTVGLNVAAAHGWANAVAQALAPVSYAVLVEMLAHLLRLHLRLIRPSRARITFLTWASSPVVTTRVWLHLARTGGDDPAAARALVQQLIRMASRLRAVCPGRWPLGRVRAAHAAALQTIRDGLLSAETLARLLPDDGVQLQPGELLALVDRAALRCTAPAAPGCTAADAPECTGTAAPLPHQSGDGVAHRERTDAELVAELHRHGGPLSGRQVMRLFGVGTPKATRLVRLAGWAPPEPETRPSDHASHPARPLQIVTESRLRHSQSQDRDDEDHDATSTTSGSAP